MIPWPEVAMRCSKVAMDYSILNLAIEEFPPFRETAEYVEYLKKFAEVMTKMVGHNVTEQDVAELHELAEKALKSFPKAIRLVSWLNSPTQY